MAKHAPKKPVRDPCEYHGLVRRSDGAKPYNSHLYPSEQWVCERENPKLRYVDFRCRIEVWHIIPAPGEAPIWTTSGSIWDIEGRSPTWPGQRNYRHIWPSRDQAIRASAARMVRMVRAAARDHVWGLVGLHHAPRIIAWAFEVVARETGKPVDAPVFRLPAPLRQPTGMPLFDVVTS